MTWNHRLEFWVDGNPKAQPRPRSHKGGGGVRNPPTADGWKLQIASKMRFSRIVPRNPIRGIFKVDYTAFFHRPKRMSRSTHPLIFDAYGGKIPLGCVYMPITCDKDNLLKPVLDVLSRQQVSKFGIGYFHDDAMVCSGNTEKYFHEVGGNPGGLISIYQWGG